MKQNVFMAQTHFYLPLKQISRKYEAKINLSTTVKQSFVSQRNEMQARFISLGSHRFSFRSYPYGTKEYLRTVQLRAHLLSYKMYAKQQDENLFLVIGTNVDKFFPEPHLSMNPLTFQQRICTALDLIYLQEALRQNLKKGRSFPLADETTKLRAWIEDLIEEITESPIDDGQTPLILESVTIDVRSAKVFLPMCPNEQTLNERFNASFYGEPHPDFNRHWQGDDTLFALCLLQGNGNPGNVSERQIERFRNHKFTNNKNEMTYANKNGIAFLRTHHPFKIRTQKDWDNTLKTFSEGLKDVQNVHEICAALCAKIQLEELGQQLDEEPNENVRHILGQIATFLNKKLTNVTDLNNKYRFIYKQMGITTEFNNLKSIGELKADAYQLKLSHRLNIIITAFTALAGLVAILQIIQNHLNTYHQFMETQNDLNSLLTKGCTDSVIHFCGDFFIMLLLLLLLGIIVVGGWIMRNELGLRNKPRNKPHHDITHKT